MNQYFMIKLKMIELTIRKINMAKQTNVLILIGPNWELEFYVHIDAFQLVIKVILA
jgi:hypothetical protein